MKKTIKILFGFLIMAIIASLSITLTNKEDSVPEINPQTLLKQMTLEEKVGQMFIIRHPQKNAKEYITNYHIGGYILFGVDFKNETKESIKIKINEYQKISKIPLFIAVDEEGGKVNRVSKYPAFRTEPFKSSRELYKIGGFEKIKEDTKEKSNLLREIGINTNFAPVVDIVTNPESYMYERSVGLDSELTSNYTNDILKIMNEENIISVLKHFPGYGNNFDTHKGITIDNKSLNEFNNRDFKPFREGIKNGADMILISHIVVSKIDSVPASISNKVINILRNDLGFKGVIVTDCLDMEGIKAYTKDNNVGLMAVLAGNDLICTTDFQQDIESIIDAVKSGKIKEKRIDESVLRILKLKIKKQLTNK